VTVIAVEPLFDEGLSLAISDICKILQRELEISPYDVVMVKPGSLSRSDNGKTQSFKVRNNYENQKLHILCSLRNLATSKFLSETDSGKLDEVEKSIEQAFKSILNIDKELSRTSNFFDLGGDSLSIMQLVIWVEESYNVKMDIIEVIEDMSIMSIAQYIKMKIYNGKALLKVNTKLMYEDCVLDEDIVVGHYENSKLSKVQNVFLTGVTGFLGGHLLKDLIENTEAKIYCHIRAKDIDEGMKRIIANMQNYRLWKHEYKVRIVPVVGDLSKPLLGISEDYFNKLADCIDIIYHNGACVNFVLPYSKLKEVNVRGTRECLRLACRKKAKYFNYISTFGVFDNPSHFNKIAYEDDKLDSCDGYFLGYTQTKWVSEKLVKIAENRGLKVCIYRPGHITGSTVSGIWEVGDLISRLLVSCINMKVIPDIFINIHITPVDYVSKAIAYLSLREDSIGKAFNLINKIIPSAGDLSDAIRQYGYNIDVIPYEQWQNTMFNNNTTNMLKILECLFKQNVNSETSIIRRYSDMEPIIDTTNVDNALIGSNIQCPSVTFELLFKYLDYFKTKSYI
jgi:thioester reductase-like protein